MSNKKKKKHIVEASKNPDDSNEELGLLAKIILGVLFICFMFWPIFLMMFVSFAKDGFSWEVLFKCLAIIPCFFAISFVLGSIREASNKPLGSEKEEPKN